MSRVHKQKLNTLTKYLEIFPILKHIFGEGCDVHLDDVADAVADVGAHHHLREPLDGLLLDHLDVERQIGTDQASFSPTCLRASLAAWDSPYMFPNTPWKEK